MKWTNKDLEFLKANYATHHNRFMGHYLKREPKAVAQKARKLGLVKEIENSGRFKKGRKAILNNGYLHPNTVAQRFKKGHVPANTTKQGTISVRYTKGIPYNWIKVNKDWMQYNRYVWSLTNGEIPSGHVVKFIDGNTLNNSISNLKCIPLTEHIELNRNRPKASATIKQKNKIMWIRSLYEF